MDPFTQKRLMKFVVEHRAKTGELPMLTDFEKGGFAREQVKRAEKLGLIEEFYVTLTSGTIRKGYKLVQKGGPVG